MIVLLRTKPMQPCRHTNSEAFPTVKDLRYIYTHRINFRMSEVRENKMALRKLSGGIAHAHLRGNIGHHLQSFLFIKI